MTWKRRAYNKLLQTEDIQPIVKRARNVILFLGDGMGISTVTAARMLNGDETSLLYFENFPNVALSKYRFCADCLDYCADCTVTDSAASSTAYQCGAKTNSGVLGVDAHVQRSNCTQSRAPGVALTFILDWSLSEGKSVGLVTNTRVTHATPAGAYANTPERDWEGDVDLTPDAVQEGCRDIARQLVEDYPQVQVGESLEKPRLETYFSLFSVETRRCAYQSSYDVQEWSQNQQDLNRNSAYVWNAAQLRQLDIELTHSILGLFSQSHMDFEMNRKNEEQPSLTEMTTTAIRLLKRTPERFLCCSPGGMIDQSHHDNVAYHALHDTIAFANAIEAAASLTSEEETLTVITADHSHTMVIAGYSSRDNGILSKCATMRSLMPDGRPFTSLLYGDGPGYRHSAQRNEVTNEESNMANYTQEAAVPISTSSHGGEDVAIYAKGPMSHLFRGVQEQNYIAHVMAYASCVGQYKRSGKCPQTSYDYTCDWCRSSALVVNTLLLVVGALVSMVTL
ncbi:hypothetical protein C0Q70_03586 [Pomacea canaliculata]|uniref:Alkaline phosphatase, tissue-nonspecific isozyme n=1 Tax=Pomacea canaliculata TaxID=400727 RepID=A0A2T7PT50_POMCA|nr:hypothetical protein C0Q70_03586 [Pomacea canaliculata]